MSRAITPAHAVGSAGARAEQLERGAHLFGAVRAEHPARAAGAAAPPLERDGRGVGASRSRRASVDSSAGMDTQREQDEPHDPATWRHRSVSSISSGSSPPPDLASEP